MRRLRAARMLTDFDSSVNMVRALGSFFRGRDHRGLSMGPGSDRLADAVAALPRPLRRRVFVAMGFSQGIPLDRARAISSDDISAWATSQYGPGPYPAVVIGSASGAALHLAAAMRAPFLPQTTLVAVRDRGTHPDDPEGALNALAPITKLIARNNRDVAVYHMHDPAQDRPMLEAMAYMRLKRLRLGREYERFLEERLAPGATIIQFECTRTWRSRAVGERAYFQFGCLGGVPEEEYHDSGARIAEYLARENSPRRRWEPPEPDGRRPEAEWGYDPALSADIATLAERHGYALRRLVVHEPQDLSPLVADLYRWWYRQRGMPGDRLIAESYVQWDPLWILRLGAVPFWLRFNMEPSYESLRSYLTTAEPYRKIHLNLFSQGLRSPGLVPLERWRELVSTAALDQGELVGVDARSYPADPGSSLRFQPAFEALPPRHPLPAPLPVDAIDRYLARATRRDAAEWIDPFAVPSLSVLAPGDPPSPGAPTQSMWKAWP
jgi:hypothetical protein